MLSRLLLGWESQLLGTLGAQMEGFCCGARVKNLSEETRMVCHSQMVWNL